MVESYKTTLIGISGQGTSGRLRQLKGCICFMTLASKRGAWNGMAGGMAETQVA
jgi:hypothetical protein